MSWRPRAILGGLSPVRPSRPKSIHCLMREALLFLVIETQNDYVRFHGSSPHLARLEADLPKRTNPPSSLPQSSPSS